MNKKILTIVSALTVFVLLMVAGCGGGASKEKKSDEVTDKESVEAAEAAPSDVATSAEVPEKFALGKKIYDEKCAVCHQADGSGMAGAFPPLKNSDYLLEDPLRGIEQTLNGSFEEMEVNGETYNAPMVPQVDTKEEALAVINYVLKYYNDSDVELTMENIHDLEIKPREE